MKKLSLIVAMAVVLTIGGVFATWQYTTTEIDLTSASATGIGVEITGGDTAGVAGKIESSGSLSYSILDPNNDYVAVLTPNGAVTFTFTANTGSDYLMNDVPLQVTWTAKLNQNKQVEGTTITVFNEDSLTLASDTVTLYAQDSASGPNSFTLDNDDLGLVLNSWTLDTKGEYDKFEAAVNGTTITIEVGVVSQ